MLSSTEQGRTGIFFLNDIFSCQGRLVCEQDTGQDRSRKSVLWTALVCTLFFHFHLFVHSLSCLLLVREDTRKKFSILVINVESSNLLVQYTKSSPLANTSSSLTVIVRLE